MAKQTRFITIAFVSIVLSFAALFQPPASSSQQSTTTASRNAALIAATAEVLKETSEIRQLAILRPVQSSTRSRPEIERMLIKNLDEETTPAQIHAAEITLKRLGLAPPDFQYRALMLRVLTEQVAGYYDPKTGEFHLADWIDLDGQRPIMAHELTHALQDQHFNLRRFEHWPKGDSDAELATHALVEGDATLAMALYVANNAFRAMAFLKSLGTMGMASQELEKAPRALRETLLFPYQQGTNWTKTLFRQAGWNRVSQAFTELPQSTEQILHPEKYLAHESPMKVSLPDITSLLNNPGSMARSGQWVVGSARSTRRSLTADCCPLPTAHHTLLYAHRPLPTGSWRRIDYDVEGEWGFYLILDEFLKSPADSRRASSGWGGDRFAVYEGPKGEVLFVSLSTWDSEKDAREFFDGYVKRTELRYPGAEKSGPGSPASKQKAANPTDQQKAMTETASFSAPDSDVILQLRGNLVLILEGLPAQVNRAALLNSLGRIRP